MKVERVHVAAALLVSLATEVQAAAATNDPTRILDAIEGRPGFAALGSELDLLLRDDRIARRRIMREARQRPLTEAELVAAHIDPHRWRARLERRPATEKPLTESELRAAYGDR